MKWVRTVANPPKTAATGVPDELRYHQLGGQRAQEGQPEAPSSLATHVHPESPASSPLMPPPTLTILPASLTFWVSASSHRFCPADGP